MSQQVSRLKIDELNVNRTITKRAIPYSIYFGEMDLTEEEKEKRIALANSFEEVFLFLFTVLSIEIALGNEVDVEYYTDMLARRLEMAITGQGFDIGDYEYIKQYCKNVASEIIVGTIADNGKEIKNNDPYLTSGDRAMFIAENEANAVRNYLQLEEALKKGFTKKKWVTKHDRKVRHTHELVDGETIGIYDTFLVGDSEMMFPKDTTLGAEAREIVGCRCICKYFKK